MARPLSDLDPTEGPLAAFAHDLRSLRADAGEPTLDVMAQRANLSRTALSDAMSGKKLPSALVVAGFAKACGSSKEDTDIWTARRDELARLPQPVLLGVQVAGAATDSLPVSPAPRSRLTPAILAVAVVVSLVFGVGAGTMIGRATAPAAEASTPAPTPSVPSTGDDPVEAGCTEDKIIASAQTQPDGTLVELLWSEKCSANWGRITRYDNQNEGNSVTTVLTGHFENAPSPQMRMTVDQQGAYTPIMIVESDEKACVTGSWTVGEENLEVTKPACW
jgi:hypothetical protein